MLFSKRSLPSTSFLVVIGLVHGFLSACASAPAVPVVPQQMEDGVEFSLVLPNVQSVAVVGDFNDWSHTADLLGREDGDRWSGVVPLASGEHVFMFVVNGEQWVVPPMAEDYVDDGFGQKNGVVVVREE
ncbi:MAG: isoamylase early set domain-containing protein [Nitrospirota bacterium]|nr:isoamylase early set domain-containing protein [Nitrospirota bacterium]MDH5587300.1 isoamylase early set domain-containing protein [Nitrospirota bacterium]MDH5773467.1 isoamylase early set domain-containing protein [Nitrospirota bacterium]